MKLPFKKIDAFATNHSLGNPAGYIALKNLDDLSETKMLQIAKELKGFVNEVGYVAIDANNECWLKYYSSEREVDFCGHATIAILYDLIKTNTDLQKLNEITIHTNKGTLAVQNQYLSCDSVFIMSPEPVVHKNIPSAQAIASNLKITEEEIDNRHPISVINAGLTTLLVPIENLHAILKINPDLHELKDFCMQNGIDIIEVFTSEVKSSQNNYRTRVFAPTFGYLEDPATGSGNSAFGYYLQNNSLWNGDTILIEQNGTENNYNIVKLISQNDTNGNLRVWFGGNSITRIEGMYIL